MAQAPEHLENLLLQIPLSEYPKKIAVVIYRKQPANLPCRHERRSFAKTRVCVNRNQRLAHNILETHGCWVGSLLCDFSNEVSLGHNPNVFTRLRHQDRVNFVLGHQVCGVLHRFLPVQGDYLWVGDTPNSKCNYQEWSRWLVRFSVPCNPLNRAFFCLVSFSTFSITWTTLTVIRYFIPFPLAVFN